MLWFYLGDQGGGQCVEQCAQLARTLGDFLCLSNEHVISASYAVGLGHSHVPPNLNLNCTSSASLLLLLSDTTKFSKKIVLKNYYNYIKSYVFRRLY